MVVLTADVFQLFIKCCRQSLAALVHRCFLSLVSVCASTGTDLLEHFVRLNDLDHDGTSYQYVVLRIYDARLFVSAAVKTFL